MSQHPLSRTVATLALTAAMIGALAGCSSSSAPGPTRSATPTSSASASATKTVYDKCVDGHATILASDVAKGKPFTLRGACDSVSIVGKAKNHTTIHLPDTVKLLVIEGDDTTVDAHSVATIIVPGSHNTITYKGTADVQDQGQDNSITAAQ